MPEYRDVKKPAALASKKLTAEELETIKAGNEAAIGTGIADGKSAAQLDIWYPPGKTLVAGRRDGKTIVSWSFKGYVSPENCRDWYSASLEQPA